MSDPDVKTAIPINEWEFSTRTYKGTCPLVKDSTTVSAIFRMDNAKEFPDVCHIEQWFKDTVENNEWSAEALVENCADYWKMDVTVIMSAHSHGPIKVRCSC